MSNKITPNVKELLGKSEDELREILSELNKPSLMKLSREAIQSVIEYINYADYLKEEEKQLLYGRLNDIIALAERKITS